MEYYDLFMQGPSTYIPALAISLLITLAAYGAYPLLYAKLQNEPITAKNYRRVCYFANLIPLIFFFFLSDKPSPWAYMLWSSVFASFGKQILERRNLLADPDAPASVPSDELPSDSALEYTEKIQQPAAPVPAPGEPKKSKSRFCKHCGSPIDPLTKKCTGCGKQYFRLPKINKSRLNPKVIVVLSLLIVCLCVWHTIQYQNQVTQLNNRISELEEELESCKQTVSDVQQKYSKKVAETASLMQENRTLTNKVKDMEHVYKFCYDHVVVVSDDGTRLYHRIQCPNFVTSRFWAYNLEAAEQKGYRPCSYCFSSNFNLNL